MSGNAERPRVTYRRPQAFVWGTIRREGRVIRRDLLARGRQLGLFSKLALGGAKLRAILLNLRTKGVIEFDDVEAWTTGAEMPRRRPNGWYERGRAIQAAKRQARAEGREFVFDPVAFPITRTAPAPEPPKPAEDPMARAVRLVKGTRLEGRLKPLQPHPGTIGTPRREQAGQA